MCSCPGCSSPADSLRVWTLESEKRNAAAAADCLERSGALDLGSAQKRLLLLRHYLNRYQPGFPDTGPKTIPIFPTEEAVDRSAWYSGVSVVAA